MSMDEALNWIEGQKEMAFDLLSSWVLQNSWSGNVEGLKKLKEQLLLAFSPLGDEVESILLPPWQRRDSFGALYFTPLGPALSIRKRKESRKNVLLGGHMDTVYPPLPNPLKIRQEGSKLIGPGIADMKGGLVVLWLAIKAFENFFSDLNLGWEIFINPDEEIGSPGSRSLWEERAKRANIGLLFEPCFPDGSLVGARKGSITFTLAITGQESHVGRAHAEGRSAVKALAELIFSAHVLAKEYPEMTLNIASLTSSEALNIIPKHASCKGNIRSFNATHLEALWVDLEKLCEDVAKNHRVKIDLYKDAEKLPKPFENKTKALYEWIERSAHALHLPLKERPSGGLSDGNILQASGLPTIDTMGVVGGDLHTENEYMLVESLVERAKLTCLFLHDFALKMDE